MQVPTMKTMIVYSDFEGNELEKAVIDFLDKDGLESYEYEREIIYSYKNVSHSDEYDVHGSYKGAGEIYKCENLKRIPFVRFQIIHVLEYKGYYFAQTIIN